MKTVVGVLRGGPSSEYEVSLKSGASVLANLNQERFEPRDIFIDRSGVWHLHGAPVSPEQALRGVGVLLNIVHGEYGEDGRLHRIIDAFNIPYVGSGMRASMLAFDKARTKQEVKKIGIKTPRALLIGKSDMQGDPEQFALNLFRAFPHPAIVKPAIGGSSVGMTKVEHYHALPFALERAFVISPSVLVEEFIKGREATVGVIDQFRNEQTYALMPVEIIPPAESPFFDYEAKYGGKSIERVPGSFTDAQKRELADAAKRVHEHLGVSHYSRSDFIVSPRGVYFLEINNPSAVGMTGESLFPKAIEAVGLKMPDFLEHVIALAERRK
ncbi:MAG TPA: ATP-grasp domain-containing protein [Candidatus Paceibacterota bacterium]|nr:ATP-grasp domain-containing protein [Candidatus Paceibacterota bacterium]